MPRVTRTDSTRTPRFKTTLFIMAALLFVGGGSSALFGYLGGGAINVESTILNTDQSAATHRVNPYSRSTSDNGGLRPASLDPNAQTAPGSEEATKPVTPPPEASSTEDVADTTEGETSTEPEVPAEASAE